MSRVAVWAAVLAASVAGAVSAQNVQTYTENQSGSNLRPLGYPVPRPVASLTPVDGFRDYASLDARLQSLDAGSDDLLGHVVGTTRNGRSVRAYVVSDSNGEDREGRAEAAFFINASTHAREWATQEVSTYLIERMISGAGDEGLVRYLLDNTRLVIIPVQNIDGFLQTQRYPDQVVVGRDPRVPNDWPRDGRMRRKNMPGVDEILTTFGDHLVGVDLNRNHPPFWGTTTLNGQLTNPDELVYRGVAAHSEPENAAVVQAATLAPASRIRLGIDVHTFSQVFFSSNTGRTRLNQIQTQLIALISQHHAAVPTVAGTPNGRFYADIPDPANRGIGVAAEYFAYSWLVPAWTLEIEPVNGGSDYGGSNDSHSGFILPASQIRRVREAWAESHLVAFYFMAGPPHLQRLRLRDAETGQLLSEQRWVYDAASGRRQRVEQVVQALSPQQRVRMELSFSKPMRYRNASGQLDQLPGSNVLLMPRVALRRNGVEELLDTSNGQWLTDSGYLKYRDDSFAFEFTASGGDAAIEVRTSDMVGLSLDADPSTPVDWSSGAWSEWEDENGFDGDSGGADRLTASLSVLTGSAPQGVSIAAVPAVAGEGDALIVDVQRAAESAGTTVILEGRVGEGAIQRLTFASGESGLRSMSLPISDDIDVQGERSLTYRVVALVGETASEVEVGSGSVRVLDNDAAGRTVVRVRDDLNHALDLIRQSNAAERELVVDGGRSYAGPSAPMLPVCLQHDFVAPLRLYGNHAELIPGDNACSGPRVSGSGTVELRDVRISGQRAGANTPQVSGVEGEGARLQLERVVLGPLRGSALNYQGEVELRRSSIQGAVEGEGDDALIAVDGRLQVEASTVLSTRSAGDLLAVRANGASSALASASLLGNSSAGRMIPAPLTLQSSLLQDNQVRGSGGATPVAACDPAVQSLGFNLYDGQDCPLNASGDRLGVSLALGAPSGPERGYVLPVGEAVDLGGECAGVDQRGAPRPQSLSGTARCDAGAVEAGINPWRGFWIPARPGHGIDMQTVGNTLFLLWYTYGDDGEPTAYQAAAPLTGPNWSADLLLARRNPTNAAISNQVVGRITLAFTSDTEATLGWQFDAHPGVTGSEALTAYVFAEGEPRFEVTGTWYPPAEDGNGASISRRGEVTAMALYYYDAAGNLRWALGNGAAADAQEIELLSFTGFCPDCDAQTRPVQFQTAGRAVLHFLTPQRLRLDSDVTYPGGAGGRWQRAAAQFVPINDPVDNRGAAAEARR